MASIRPTWRRSTEIKSTPNRPGQFITKEISGSLRLSVASSMNLVCWESVLGSDRFGAPLPANPHETHKQAQYTISDKRFFSCLFVATLVGDQARVRRNVQSPKSPDFGRLEKTNSGEFGYGTVSSVARLTRQRPGPSPRSSEPCDPTSTHRDARNSPGSADVLTHSARLDALPRSRR